MSHAKEGMNHRSHHAPNQPPSGIKIQTLRKVDFPRPQSQQDILEFALLGPALGLLCSLGHKEETV